MGRILGAKLVELIVVLAVVSLVSFAMLSLVPGDNPELRMLGDSATPEAVADLRAELGLDDPFPQRYGRWLGDVLQGDLGRSTTSNQDVTAIIAERLPITLQLAAMSLAIGLLFAVPLGVISAWRAGGWIDRIVTSTSFAVLSLPSFLIAIVLIIVFAVRLRVLPAAPAWVPLTEDPITNLRNLILPVTAMALGEIAVLTRVLRSDMIDVLQLDYIQTARAKGMPTRFVLLRHALPAALLSMLTLVGLQVAGAMTGAVVIEQIFGLPGLGRTLLLAILSRDLVVVQGLVLVIAGAYVVVNSLVDLAYRLVDPRIRRAS